MVRPEERHWVRIRNGLYQDDLGVVEKYIDDSKIYVKLIPRVAPQKSKEAKMTFMRMPQNVFDEKEYPGGTRIKPNYFNKHFYSYKNSLYRKGFIYKTFSLKQIDS